MVHLLSVRSAVQALALLCTSTRLQDVRASLDSVDDLDAAIKQKDLDAAINLSDTIRQTAQEVKAQLLAHQATCQPASKNSPGWLT